ncbi:MAG: lysine biosynthesis protein LysX [Desulfurococcales archaeon]|nr:lysine biosynthesis protein LysX [Desulfurococcales archaeon]
MTVKVGIAYTIYRWEEKELTRAFRERGAEVRLFHLEEEPIAVGVRDQHRIDICIQRSIVRPLAPAVSAAIESQGIRVVNRSVATLIAQDKAVSLSILSSKGIPVPRTYVAYGLGSILEAAKLIGYPLVYKPSQGSWGRLVSLVKDEEILRTLYEHREAIQDPRARVGLVQELVDKGDRDIRALVVGSRVVGAMYRVGEFVTNYARGSEVVAVKLPPEVEDLAVRAAEALGLEIAGVDIFEKRSGGYIVNEVNPVPEFKGVAAATGIDIAGIIANYIISLVRR